MQVSSAEGLEARPTGVRYYVLAVTCLAYALNIADRYVVTEELLAAGKADMAAVSAAVKQALSK